MRLFILILGALLVVGGVGLLYTSHYVTLEVTKGEHQIQSAQRKVDQAQGLLDIVPQEEVRGIGSLFTEQAQTEIDAKQAEASDYQRFSQKLEKSGWILFLGGIGFILLSSVLFLLKKK